MKKITIIIFSACIFFLTANCGEPEDNRTCIGMNSNYRLSNRSGHTISIVHKPTCDQLGDSLILFSGKDYGFGEGGINYDLFYGYDFTSRIIYYDGNYALNIIDLPKNRNFIDPHKYNYNSDLEEHIFTFTEEDYRYAIENGTKIGK